ncbi:hypothetical protein IFR05_011222 [Cadophora sp. M221]|nr:hypothetical protein IFR05_011222 [Cadophora sp. M221]
MNTLKLFIFYSISFLPHLACADFYDLLYSGVSIPKDVYFNFDPAADNKLIKARVPVFAVTGVVECKHYDLKNGNGICPPIPPSTTPYAITPYPSGIEILGVGSGRVGDGQPHGTPDKNPLLNVKEIKGEAPVAYWPGYVISKEGITIGLTGFNTGGMQFTKLKPRVGPGPGPPPHPYDWGELPGCVKLDTAPCRPVSLLLDTGIDYSNVRLPLGTTWTNRDSITQKLKEPADVGFVLGDPAVETIHFVVRHDLAIPADNEEPDYVHAYGRDGLGSFVNTGSHAYRILVVAFDAVLGRMGFKRV